MGNNHLHQLGGSESHTHALAEEFIRLGHNVDIFAPASRYSAYADDLGITLNKLTGGYDFAFVSHRTTVSDVLALYPEMEGRIVQTVHGTACSLELPHPKAQIVVISEELQSKYGGNIIRNGVNLDRFCPSCDKGSSKLLSMSQSAEFNYMLHEVCDARGIEFRYRDKNVNPRFDIESDMQWADIVVGIGRGAYEAMACGCAVIVADNRAYQGSRSDGWAHRGSYNELLLRNCSGRSKNIRADAEHIHALLDSYGPDLSAFSSFAAANFHDIRSTAQQYLNLIDRT